MMLIVYLAFMDVYRQTWVTAPRPPLLGIGEIFISTVKTLEL